MSPDIRGHSNVQGSNSLPARRSVRRTTASRAPIPGAGISTASPQGRAARARHTGLSEGEGAAGRDGQDPSQGLALPVSEEQQDLCTNLHEGISQVTSSIHHWQMAPRHDLHLQLPRHRLGFVGLSSGSRRHKRASLRRAPRRAGEAREPEGRGAARPGGSARVTDSAGRARKGAPRCGAPRTPGGDGGQARAGAEASFPRGSRPGPSGFLCPGSTALARDAEASQHRAELPPPPPLLAFLLPTPPPPKNGGSQGVKEASIDLSALDPLRTPR